MVLGGEHVDDRHRGEASQLLHERVGTGADADRRHVAGEDIGGVAHGLAPGHLRVLLAQDHGMAAELVHARLEGDPRPR